METIENFNEATCITNKIMEIISRYYPSTCPRYEFLQKKHGMIINFYLSDAGYGILVMNGTGNDIGTFCGSSVDEKIEIDNRITADVIVSLINELKKEFTLDQFNPTQYEIDLNFSLPAEKEEDFGIPCSFIGLRFHFAQWMKENKFNLMWVNEVLLTYFLEDIERTVWYKNLFKKSLDEAKVKFINDLSFEELICLISECSAEDLRGMLNSLPDERLLEIVTVSNKKYDMQQRILKKTTEDNK